MAQRFDKLNLRTSLVIGRTGGLDGAYPLDVWGQSRIRTGDSGGFTTNASHDDLIIEGAGNTGLQLFSPNTSYQYIAFGDTDGSNPGYIRYYHGTNEMRLRTNGSDNLTITGGGNVGIGTTSPSKKLEVESSTTPLHLNRTGGSTALIGLDIAGTNRGLIGATTTAAFVSYSTSASPLMTILNTGNVGIGTTSPVGRLEVVTTDANRYIRFKAPNGEERFQFYTGGTGNPATQHMYNADGTTKNVQIAAGGTSYFNGGNVGIGTTSPDSKLTLRDTSNVYVDIQGDGSVEAGIRMRYQNNGNAGSKIFYNTPNAVLYYDNLYTYSSGNVWGSHNFRNRDAGGTLQSRLYIAPLGNVGIGTASPAEKLHVTGNVHVDGNNTNYLDLDADVKITGHKVGNSGTEYTYLRMYNGGDASINIGTKHSFGYISFESGSGAYTERMRITNNGNVGIGTTSPSDILHVSKSGANTRMVVGNNSTYDQFIYFKGNTDWSMGIDYSNSNAFTLSNYSSIGTNRRLTVTTGGNVGIGTTSPSYPLHVAGDIFSSSRVIGDDGISTRGVFKSWSVYSYSNGILIQTDIDVSTANAWDNRMIMLTAYGMTYSSEPPITASFQCYNYNNGQSIVAHKGISTDESLTMDVFHYNGKVCFFMEQTSNYQTWHYELQTMGYYHKISYISNIAKPSTGITNDYTITPIKWWHSDNDGTGSGLDADLLDGLEATAFATAAQGTKADTAHGWGDHSTEGYLTSSSTQSKYLRSDESDTATGTITLADTSAAQIPLILGSSSQSTYTLQTFRTSSHTTNNAYIIAYGASHVSEAGNFAIKNTIGGKSIFFEVNNAVPLRLKTTESIFTGNVGIGTTSPAEKLHIYGTSVGIDIDGTTSSRVYYNRSGAYVWSTGLRSGDTKFHIFDERTGDRVVIDDSGNVGIGTNSPSARLHVESTGVSASGYKYHMIVDDNNAYGINNGGGIIFRGDYNSATAKANFAAIKAGKANANDGNANAYLAFLYGASGTLTEGMRIKENGNVGIGTTSPDFKLDVAGDIGMDGKLYHNGDHNTYIGFGGDIQTFRTGGVDRMTITNAGIGIGTTSPSEALNIGNNGNIRFDDNASGRGIIASSNGSNNTFSLTRQDGVNAGDFSISGYGGVGLTGGRTSSPATSGYHLYVNSSGNVGIGTTSPQAALHINKSGVPQLLLDAGGNTTGDIVVPDGEILQIGHWNNSTTTYTDRFRMNISGDIGINTTSPQYKLDVDGTIRATGDIIAYSDARVKENVETVSNALDKVTAMRGVGYNKIGEEKRSVGVIAQELLEIVPEAVHQDENGMYSVAYGNLVGVLIEAMKEQQSQINELKAQINGITK